MRPQGSAVELEARRRLAASLLANGSTCAEIAEMMGVDLSSVKRWKAAWKKRRYRSPRCQTSSRPDTATLALPEAAIGENSITWSIEVGLSHRSVDLCPCGRGNSEKVRRALSRRSCGTPVACAGLDLSEARTARTRARRSEDCPLASARLASPKKRARGEKLALFSRMRAVSCSNPRGDEPGHRAAKRPCSTPGIVTTGSRRSARLRFRPTAESSACTFASSSGTSARKIWWTACGNCTANSAGRPSWFGIVRAPIAKQPVCCCKITRAGCASSGCRLTRRTSILPSSVGITPSIPTSPTSCLTTPTNSNKQCGNRSVNNAQTKNFSVPTSRLLNSDFNQAHWLRRGQ